ncbi:MAG: hypothetical protein ED557_09920 [Balneola sp.]|nr:MAG: hypothetical protein ED557_09920 [Balneola sp.]
MERKNFEQKTLFEKRVMILHYDRVEQIMSERNLEQSKFFRYEDITNDKIFRREKSQPNYGLHVITRNISIILFFCGLFGAIEDWSWFFAFFSSSTVFFFIHLFTFKNYIEIKVEGGENLMLFKDKPGENEVDNFLGSLYLERNKYLKEHYYTTSDPSTDQGKSVLKWLLNINAITKPEFDKRIEIGERTDPNMN